MMKSIRPWARAFAILALATLVPLVPFALIGELPGEQWLALSEEDSLRFGLTGAALLAADVLLPIPSSLVGALLGGRLGFVAGFTFTWAGLCAGLCVGYAVGRLVPARFASEVQEAPSLALVFLSRPVPVLAEAVAITAGVERLPVHHVLLSGACGNAVYAAVLNADGAALLPKAGLLPALALPLVLPVAAYALWKLKASKDAE